MVNREIFRKYDIRGVVGKDLTDETVKLIALGFGTFLKKKLNKERLTVLLGGDARKSTPEFKEIFKNALNSLGISVLDCGQVPTPIVYFGANILDVDGGCQITASHNPPEYNGFKPLIGKDSLMAEEIQEILEIIEKAEYKNFFVENFNPENKTVDLVSEYKKYFSDNFPADLGKGLKVVLDAGNGIAGIVAPDIFKSIGCEVIELYCDVDSTFPNHHPDPTVEKNMLDLIEKVKTENADLGIAFDGDGDRIGVVDDRGEIIWGDMLLTIFALSILKEKKKGTFIGEVKCSQVFYSEVAKAGGKAIMYKTGHSLIKKKMKEVGAVLAGEMSGHMFFADRYFGYDDAIYAGVRLIEILKKEERKLSEIYADLPKTVSSPEIKVDCPDSKKFKVIEKIQKALIEKQVEIDGLENVITVDGVRMEFLNGWGLIRASNTQPVLVLRFEGYTEQDLNEIKEKTIALLNTFLPQV
ncbi:phosphomannomutase / phosphoglucomutase [Thermotomaculum hydrothermale]|uniref:Phosphomannomutase / phosphoglucomutase n=1 Tax=Thermotomaculum hydrothermale TaxID=981385 RepID=A0A7R6PNX6_9BACT|nr:phosphomannomutase/phosphoglucomutase [Thermotomaculum hydrothermale]BBB31676.1 phosphomannomutase / phosphoglucomutase [Thermotomaculum hydrothermale]